MKILILSASVGSGHMRAAQAVEAALRERHPEVETKLVDVLELANRAFRKAYGDGYIKMANSAPHLLGYLYDKFDAPAQSSLRDPVRRLIQRWSLRAFPRFLEEGSWDLVLNTHFLPAELVAELRRQGRLDLPQVTVVTDFEAHRFWMSTPCEHFFTATEDAASALRYAGVHEDAISVTGIPIHPVFSRPQPRRATLERFGIPGDRPLVLQLSGGSGMGPIEEVYSGLLKVDVPCDLVVVTGRNEGARRRLESIPARGGHRTHLLGYTDRMHELMSAADLIVSKPGGLTTSEAMATGLPIVAVHPIPGQESRNCDFLLENGAGIKINSIAALPQKVSALLRDPARLALMRRSARRLGRPDAAFAVARKAIEIASARYALARAPESWATASEPRLAASTLAATPHHQRRPWGHSSAVAANEAAKPA